MCNDTNSLFFRPLKTIPTTTHSLTEEGQKKVQLMKIINIYKRSQWEEMALDFWFHVQVWYFLILTCTDFDLLLIFWLGRSNTCLQRMFETHNVTSDGKISWRPSQHVWCLLKLYVLWQIIAFITSPALPRNLLWTNWKFITGNNTLNITISGTMKFVDLLLFIVENAQYLFLPSLSVFFSRICDGLGYGLENISSLATPVARLNFLVLLIIDLES